MQFGESKLKEYLKHIANSLNIFLVILFSIMSYFLIDAGFSILNLNSTNIVVSVQESQDRPFVPDCLGIRGGSIDGVWMDPQGFHEDGNWRLTSDNVYHMIHNEPIKLSVNYTEFFDLVFNCGPTQAVAKIDVQGESFFFDCYNETEIPTGVSYRISAVQTPWKSLCLFLLRWISTIVLFLLLAAMYSYRGSTIKQRAVMEKCYMVALFFLAVGFLYVSSWTTSPKVSPYADSWGWWDVPWYRVLGKSVAAGRIPYVDMWEQKGAFAFWIYGLGDLINPRWGLFPIQCCALFVSLLFSYKIGKELKNGRTGVLCSLMTLAFLELVMDECAMIEEYNLPFLMAGTYYALKYFSRTHINVKHPPQYAVIYGAVCAVSLGFRVTNCIPICIFILCITVFLIAKKEYKNLCQNIFAFLGGFFGVYLPVLIYFAANGALYDLLAGTILYSIRYTQQAATSIHSPDEWILILCYLLPAIVSMLLALEQKSLIRVGVFMAALIYGLFLSKMYVYPHYYITILIFVPIAISWLCQRTDLKDLPCMNRYHVFFAVATICILLPVAQDICKQAENRYNMVISLSKVQEISEDVKSMRQQIQHIPQEERNDVLGYNVHPKWYLDMNILPCYKFFAGQDAYVDGDERKKEEIIIYFQSMHAKWLIVKESIAIEEIAQIVDQHYECLDVLEVPSENAQFHLYHLK